MQEAFAKAIRQHRETEIENHNKAFENLLRRRLVSEGFDIDKEVVEDLVNQYKDAYPGTVSFEERANMLKKATSFSKKVSKQKFDVIKVRK